MRSIIRSLNVIAAHVDPYYLKTSSDSLLQYRVHKPFYDHEKKLIFDYLVTQNSIANANKRAWSAERKMTYMHMEGLLKLERGHII
jgi:hypothetical protein